MEETDDTELVKIRTLFNAIATGEIHVDYQDTAHDNQTLLMKLCYLETNEDDLLEILDEIMARNPNVNARDSYGRTALIHACISQNHTMADGLLYHDFTLVDAVDKEGCTALTYTIRLNDDLMAGKILSHPKARTSNLLTTKTNGRTPLEMAALVRNEAIINIIKTVLKCSSSTHDVDWRTVTSPIKPLPSLPDVRVPRALARAFLAAKSHSDPLLISSKKDQRTRFSQETPLSVDSHFSNIASSAINSREERGITAARGDNPGQTAAKYTNTLPVLFPSSQRHSRRRGSVSLPDLTSLPPVLANVSLESDSDSETEYSDSESSDDSQNVIDESEGLLYRTAASRRKNSISLPDLCCAQFSNFGNKTNLGSRTNSCNRICVPDHGLAKYDGSGFPSTNQKGDNIQCGERRSVLKLPDIHLCQSPSLPALDRISLRKMNLITHKSVHDLNSPVRRPIDGETENLRKRLSRRKEKWILQSIS